MNINLQLFSEEVVAALKAYKDSHPDLENCDATVAFIIRIHNLIVAMTSRSSQDALYINLSTHTVSRGP